MAIHLRTITIVLLCGLGSVDVNAQVLEADFTVYLQPGDMLSQQLKWNRQPGTRIEIKLQDAPADVALSFDVEGKLWIKWDTDIDLPEETTLIVLARDLDSGNTIDKSQIIVRNATKTAKFKEDQKTKPHDGPVNIAADPTTVDNAQSAQVQQSDSAAEAQKVAASGHSREIIDGAATNIAQDIPDPPRNAASTPNNGAASGTRIDQATDTPPVRDIETTDSKLVAYLDNSTASRKNRKGTVLLGAINNQIVSVGRAVSFKVNASSSSSSPLEVTIDRLPKNASFEKSVNGNYRFYWQTGVSDQGEHRFRIKAWHAAEPQSISSQDVVIVVGSPGASSTQPDEALESGS